MKLCLLCLVSAIAIGCPAPAPAPAPPPSGVAPDPTPPAPATGQTFATTTTYQGDCAPAGSRGGCHSITFQPDGTYSEMLYDAAVSGRYVIDGDAVALTPNSEAAPSRLPLAADRATLGTFTLVQ